jgi:hypothetical protein
LTFLLTDEQVQHNLDSSLKGRVERLIQEKEKLLIQKKMSQLSYDDRNDHYGRTSSEDISQKFQNIVIRESSSRNKGSNKSLLDDQKFKSSKRT